MISYFILSLLGICTSLQANVGIPSFTKLLQVIAFLGETRIGKIDITHYSPRGVMLLTYTSLIVLGLFLLILAIFIEYYVFTKMIRDASGKQTLYALISANLISGIIGGLPLFFIMFPIARFTPDFISETLIALLEWSSNPDPMLFINDPTQVLSWLVFYLIINLIIEAPVIKLFLHTISFKRIVYATFVANLASNSAYLLLIKVATLIWL